MKTTLATVAALAFIASAAPAAAQDLPSVTVAYDDINLATPAGQKRLDRRIESAARVVCDYERHLTGTRIVNSETRMCLEKARASARADVAAAKLAATKGG